MRSKLEINQMEEEDWEEERKCKELKKQWIKDFSDIFKEDLTKEDRLEIDPIKIDLVENHAEIPTYKPRTPIEVSPYMDQAAKKELARMVEAGMVEEIDYFTENLSRGFFVEKPGKTEVKARLVADFRGINKKLRCPEIPLKGSWNILRRLDPKDKYFACMDFSS